MVHKFIQQAQGAISVEINHEGMRHNCRTHNSVHLMCLQKTFCVVDIRVQKGFLQNKFARIAGIDGEYLFDATIANQLGSTRSHQSLKAKFMKIVAIGIHLFLELGVAAVGGFHNIGWSMQPLIEVFHLQQIVIIRHIKIITSRVVLDFGTNPNPLVPYFALVIILGKKFQSQCTKIRRRCIQRNLRWYLNTARSSQIHCDRGTSYNCRNRALIERKMARDSILHSTLEIR
mmetsp:Transcript_22484/g.46847  ORF Transcript_22484/g.46847 Transcript_22484/m.46847 type:complete len:231 (-) Transcript_22484:368-1060(-)